MLQRSEHEVKAGKNSHARYPFLIRDISRLDQQVTSSPGLRTAAVNALKKTGQTLIVVASTNCGPIRSILPRHHLSTSASGAASCHLSLHACNRSLFARELSIDSRAYVISQHSYWPITTPRPTCANKDALVVITPKRLKANSIHGTPEHERHPVI